MTKKIITSAVLSGVMLLSSASVAFASATTTPITAKTKTTLTKSEKMKAFCAKQKAHNPNLRGPVAKICADVK